MTEEKKFGLRLRELRNTLKLEQEPFGKKIGVSASAVGQAENGKQGFKTATLINISSTWRVNLDWLLTGDGQMFKNPKDVKQSSNLVYDDGNEKINANYAATDFDGGDFAHLRQQLSYKDKYIKLLESTNKLLEEKIEDLQNKTPKESVNIKTKKNDLKGPAHESG